MFKDRHITVVMPAHNEAAAIERVLEDLQSLTCASGIDSLVDRIIVCDNASTDDTALIASKAGCIVVTENTLGYGAACQAGLGYAGPWDVVVFVDADCSVLVSEMPLLLDEIVKGNDLVIGSRVAGLCEKYALTPPQRFGNLLASFLIRQLWNKPVTDLGPFRAITVQALEKINMQDRRFGWTVEMQVRGIQEQLKIAEVPVSTLRRVGQSKISGTVRGVIGAGAGILGMIFKLKYKELRRAGRAAFAT